MGSSWERLLYQSRFLIISAVVMGFISGSSLLSNAGKNEPVANTPAVDSTVSPGGTVVTYGDSPTVYSQVFFDEDVVQVGESTNLVVQVTDPSGQVLANHILEAHVQNGSLAEIESIQALTDAQGMMSFEITPYESGILEFSIVDHTAGTLLSDEPKLVVMEDETAGASSQKPVGGPNVVLASEAGPLAGFTIETDNSAELGDTLTVTVTAVDADGLTVTDYTGEIRFSSTDSQAELPNDYTFKAADQGQHTFSLAVSFGTEGTQILQVTDLDQFTISDQVEIEVGDSNGNTDPEDGFDLLSPASGTYSSDTIEILGEAEYGQGFVVYLDDDEVDTSEVQYDNTFEYSIDNVKDGKHELYVEIVELDEDGKASSVVMTSSVEEIEIDTTAPELTQITWDPDNDLMPGDQVTFTVLSEEDLDDVSILIEDVVYDLKETKVDGKYEVELTLPEKEGEYGVDVILADALGNEVRYRDAATLSLGSDIPEEPDQDPDQEPEEPVTVGPEAVTGLTGTAGETKVTLSWEVAESKDPIDYYMIYYGPSEDTLYADTKTYDASTTWYIPNLQSDTTFYFAVAGVTEDGTIGEKSKVISVTTKEASEPQGGSDVRPDPVADEEPEITDLPKPPANPASGPGIGLLLLGSVVLSMILIRFTSVHNT